MVKFPQATIAPAPRNPYAQYIGMAAAGVMVAFALIHLFRIDTLVPIVQQALPFADSVDAFLVALLVIAEVFAIPSLLMMRLSPLARIVSGLFAIAAPLFWLLTAMWTAGGGMSTGLLGEFAAVPSNGLLIALLAMWLTGNYLTLWLLGFDTIPAPWPAKLRRRKG